MLELADVPGPRVPQSAQRSLPGTVLISSCKVFSLRACWRLFIDIFGYARGGENGLRLRGCSGGDGDGASTAVAVEGSRS